MNYKEARYYQKQYSDNQKAVQCLLCPRTCLIKNGQSGFCGVRYNAEGVLYTLNYGHPVGVSFDPIEKKPLYHYYPGSRVLSLGTYGCNLDCRFCQNDHLSHPPRRGTDLYPPEKQMVSPENIVEECLKNQCRLLAYTYNDPAVFTEYALDIAQTARKNHIKNIAVTAGYFSKESRHAFFDLMDAVNIDLKSIDPRFYKTYCGADLKTVLETLLYVKKQTKIHLEITTLVIEGYNSSEEDMKNISQWIRSYLGKETPLHLSAFFPAYKMHTTLPTSYRVLKKAYDIARREGLHYVYIGNVRNAREVHTNCPSCGRILVQRNGYITNCLIKSSVCDHCGKSINMVL